MTGNGPDDRTDFESTDPPTDNAGDALKMFCRVRDRAEPGDREQIFESTQDTPDGHLTDTGDDGTSNAGFTNALTRIGRFEIREKLGQGGFGTVFLARDPDLNRQVALKVPGPGVVVQTELLRRFLREGETAAALDHPGIVPVYEAGHIGSIHYIVSAYVDGESLSNWLARYGQPLDAVSAARLMLQLTNAVQHAHSRGILHRDLKPANVLLDGSRPDHSVPPQAGALAECARLTDFGLAKHLETSPEGDDTRTNAILGTPAYMAPEQAEGRNRDVGIASDVYSLGSILYELLTGRPPFKRDTHVATLQAVCRDEPTPLSKIVKNAPTDLEAICLKCLEKDPEARYRSAIELGEDLSRFLAGDSVIARPIGRLERVRRWSRRKPMVAVLGAVSLGLLIALLIGSTAAAILLNESNQSVRRHLAAVTTAKHKESAAKTKAEERTRLALRSEFDSLVSQARLSRTSGRPGQRLETRSMLTRAAEICEELKLPESQRSRLRDEFMSCVSLPDAVPGRIWPGIPERVPFVVDRKFSRYAFVTRGVVVIRRFSNDEVVAQIRSEVYRIVDLKFHPAGRQLAIIGVPRDRKSGLVEIWNPESQQCIFRTSTPPARLLHRFDYSANGKRVAILREKGAVEIRNTEGFNIVEKLSFRSITVSQIYLSPDGRRVAGMIRDTRSRQYVLTVIDASGGKQRIAPPLDSPLILSLAWSRDGEQIAFVDQKQTVYVWHGSEKRFHLIVPATNTRVLRLSWEPSGRWLAVSTSDRRTRIWNTATGESALQLAGDYGTFRDDGNALAGRTGWAKFSPPSSYRTFRSHSTQPPQLIADDVLLFVQSEQLVGIDLKTGHQMASKRFPGLSRIFVASDGRTVYLDTVRSLQRRAISLDKAGSTIQFEDGDDDWSVARSFRHLLMGRERLVGQVVNRETRNVDCLSVDPSTGEVHQIPTHPKAHAVISIDRNGKYFATADRLMGLEVRDTTTGQRRQRIPVRSLNVGAAFSPAGDHIAVVEGGRCAVYSIGDATAIVQFTAEYRPTIPNIAAFSNDGGLLAFSISPGKIQLVRSNTWEKVGTLSLANSEGLHSLRFLGNDRYLVASTGSRKKAVHAWDVRWMNAEMNKTGISLHHVRTKKHSANAP